MGTILELRDVKRYFGIRSGGWVGGGVEKPLKAVDGASFSIASGSSFGVAGESGSGKSTMGKLILRLDRPTGGAIEFEGRDIGKLDAQGDAWYRTRVQAVFQDASGSLDPRMRISAIVAEPLEIHARTGPNRLTKIEIREKVEDMLAQVALPERVMHDFPHELSGGQKQRVAIARAMILEPTMLVLDEPVSALDVSIRAQVLNLLSDFQDRYGLTYLMISHDLATLGHVSSQLAVMYLGRIVEIGDTEEIYERPLHPYTKALFRAMPLPDPDRVKSAPSLRGEIGSALDLPKGCRFCPRCDEAMPVCSAVDPELVDVGAGRQVACHLIGGPQLTKATHQRGSNE
ncbi:ABC transporter ATP-binding protein [Chelativorans salis]|uniref:ABC transporter ATP-binding protein n=1 Tax=Chelativorans salis TaxID=2978478 RepID=A0ABT2LRK6_9HYPH|nr:ABC transporter ATP-binding protein [Chelativorans sp. EGI FJ00035]MCT7376724.1 ABC transporter ATP-binding protein [Chelativorans sp. EGI FJ00035]